MSLTDSVEVLAISAVSVFASKKMNLNNFNKNSKTGQYHK